MKVALTGPPASGKTTLFEAIAPTAHARRGTQGAAAMVPVPDPRVEALAAIYRPPSVVHAAVEFVDLPGLAAGSGGEQRSRTLAALREAEVLLGVAGLFDIGTGLRSPAEAAKELDDLHTELAFADLEIVERKLAKLASQIKRRTESAERDKREEILLHHLREAIEHGSVDALRLDAEQELTIRPYQFLAVKPRLTVYNLDEDRFADPAFRGEVESTNPNAIAICAGLEHEIARLSEPEQGEFLAAYGLSEPTSARMIHACYRLLDLISFLTVGTDEVRAWTVRRGDSALAAAGKIHTDIERGFIRAEVIPCDAVLEHGGFKQAKAAGAMRLEGKDYLVRDGDVISFRFNV